MNLCVCVCVCVCVLCVCVCRRIGGKIGKIGTGPIVKGVRSRKRTDTSCTTQVKKSTKDHIPLSRFQTLLWMLTPSQH